MRFRFGIGVTSVLATAILAMAPLGAWAQSIEGTVTNWATALSPARRSTWYRGRRGEAGEALRRRNQAGRPLRRTDGGQPRHQPRQVPEGDDRREGPFAIPKVADGKYFVYVEPSDREHLPGGTLANKCHDRGRTRGQAAGDPVSGKIPDNANFVGSSQCLGCHERLRRHQENHAQARHHRRRQAEQAAGLLPLPRLQRRAEQAAGGTTFYFSGFDKARGFDKYLISEKRRPTRPR